MSRTSGLLRPSLSKVCGLSLPRALTFAVLTAGLFILPPRASSSTHYVAANGSDSNNGTSETTPWLHAPGMPNCSSNCKSYTPSGGDTLIFRGGDTWHFANRSAAPYTGGEWSWSWSGSSSGSPIYIGVDQKWYSGSSWTRPVLSSDNPSSKKAVAKCAYELPMSNQMMSFDHINYVLFDNFEITGFCWSNGSLPYGDNVMIESQGPVQGLTPCYITYEHLYVHGWTHTIAGKEGTGGGFQGFNQNFGVCFQYNVIDGSDSDDASLSAIIGDNYSAAYNVFRHFGGTIVGNTCHTLHDNLFEYINNVTDGSSHTDVWFCYGEYSGGKADPNTFYNNIFRYIGTQYDEAVSAIILFSPPPGQTDYMFNNVAHDNQPGGTNYFNLNERGGPGGGNLAVFNNTGVVGRARCLICNGSGVGTVTAVNNLWITTGSNASIFGNTSTLSESHSVYITPAKAASRGYKSTNDYAPNLTVGAATSNSALCDGFSDSTARSSCLSGTGDRCTYLISDHTVSCSDLSPVDTSAAVPRNRIVSVR